MIFQVKVYDFAGTFLGVLPSEKIISDIIISSKINQIPRGFYLKLVNKFENEDVFFNEMNRVKIYGFIDNEEDGVLLFSGFINKISRELKPDGETIELEMLHSGGVLRFSNFVFGGDVEFTENKKASEILIDILNDLNTKYSDFVLTGEIEDSIDSLSVEFSRQSHFDSLKKIIELAPDFVWRIKGDGTIDFLKKGDEVVHEFVVGKEIIEVDYESDTDKIVNNVVVAWSGGEEAVVDSGSVLKYGVRDKFISDSDLNTADSAIKRGENELADFATPKVSIRLKLDPNYRSDKLNVGDICRINNLEIGQTFVARSYVIAGIKYDSNNCTIELGEKFDEIAVNLK